MSALAQLFLSEGKKVSGSDVAGSQMVQKLQEEGCQITIGQRVEHIPEDVDTVVYTIAVSKENPELVEARKRGINIYRFKYKK